MKALFYNFLKKKFLLKEIQKPEIKSDELLVRIRASALCGTDLHIMYGPLASKAYNKKEVILGHSFSGIISKIGSQVKNFKKGDRIFSSTFVWCGVCQKCREGKPNLCDNRFILGMERMGSHAEYISIPHKIAFHLPQKIDFINGSLITDLLALNIHAIDKTNAKITNRILIFGTGPVGLTLGILLRLRGLKPIFIVEPIKYRRDLAKKLFKAEIIYEKNIKRLNNCFDIIFETSGNIETLNYGQKLLKRGGKIIAIGVQRKNLNLNAFKLISRELSFLGIFEFTIKDIKNALNLLNRKKINLKRLITHKFTLEKGGKAYGLLKTRKAGRIILF